MRIIINGLYGRMGQAVLKSAIEQGHTIAAGIDPLLKEENIPTYTRIDLCTEKADGVIDFSTTQALPFLLEYGKSRGIPLVLATTGYSLEQQQSITEAARVLPIFQSANMSIGVAVLKKLVAQGAKMLGSAFDVEIVETHHRHKVDAPSGTALLLYNALQETISQQGQHAPIPTYGRQGHTGERNPREIGIHAVRGGSVAGTHQVLFLGENQSITLTHEATDRNIFALGAMDALQYLIGKKPGIYTMEDLIEEREGQR
ncbi:MAG: 4-hydroxy-tetrahydrodipicolinate reductase [Clostridiales bacterium]|nr:4-hydroxy-tetrahydrodipicolinate reductase [Clostridiales bacterium]